MKCPFCFSHETKVVDKRETEDSDVVRRRRECLKCKKRFTTYERVEDLGLIIVKKDGRRENFDAEKIKRGILKACEKRSVSYEQVDDIVNKVESELRKLKSKEISSSVIGEKVASKLKKIDKIAYIRFASVYRSFADVTDFEKELKELVKKR